MDIQKEVPQTQEELVNRVCEALRPMVTEIIKNTISADGALPNEADGQTQIQPPPLPQDVKSTEVPQTSIAEAPEFAEMTANVKAILAQVQDFVHKDKINKELHEELQLYRNGLRKEFINPMLKTVMREYDRAAQQYEFYLLKSEQEPQSELFMKLLKEFSIVALSLLDLLDNYGVTPFTAETGSEYTPGEHQILKTEDTDDKDANGKVAKCTLCGFRDIETGRMLRQAEVEIFKFK
jgi:molecular chaperone GrpE (heat shock protein)